MLNAPMSTRPGGKRFAAIARIFPWALLALLAPGVSAEPPVEEHWYRVELSGASAGYMTTRVERRQDEVVTETKTRLEVRRGTTTLALGMESRFVETPDGRPLEIHTVQTLGALPVETTYTFGERAVTLTRRQGDAVNEQELPLPAGDWLTPDRFDARVRELLATDAGDFELATLDPFLGLEPVRLRWVLEARDEEVESEVGRHRTSRWRQVPSYAPELETTSWVDAEGLLVKSNTPFMGLSMSMVLSERRAVLESPEVAPELLVRSFVRPDRPLERPRRARRAVYELRLPGGTLPELPTAGAQRTLQDGAVARITVDVGARLPAGEVDRDLYLRSTTFVPHDDPGVRALYGEAAAKLPEGTAARAEALRDFVARVLVEKNLDTGLATAAEVAATRAGDCTEHSVLLTALLRAAGIPARVVSGLIYVESFAGASKIFGYHMWSQALIDGRWVDLDATLPPPGFDAAHIAFSASALDDEHGALLEMARIVPMMGQIEIKVLAAEP